MSYTLGTAATATGLNKSTILRSIKAGRISATKNELGEWHIEPAELHRIYPPVASAPDRGDAPQHDAAVRLAELSAQIAGLREVAELLRAQRDDALAQRDKWEQQASRLALPKPDEAVEQQAQQAAQPFGPPVQQAPEQVRARRWWWRRLA
jgi:hypothetical protein